MRSLSLLLFVTLLVLSGCNLQTTSSAPISAPPASSGPVATQPPVATPLPGASASTLASNLAQPILVAVDANSVYLLERGSSEAAGVLRKLPLVGGSITALATGLHTPAALAVDNQFIYWTERGTTAGKFADGALKRLPLAGGVPEVLASNLADPQGVAVDKVNVYWSEAGSGQVRGMSTAVGPVMTFGSGLASPGPLAVDGNGNNIVWATGGDKPAVTRKPVNSAPPVVLATLPGGAIRAITADATSVAWLDVRADGRGELQSVQLAGGSPSLLATGLADPRSLVMDGTNVYWTENGLIRRVPPAGGQPTLLAIGLADPQGLAQDSANIYWAEAGAGFIRRLGK